MRIAYGLLILAACGPTSKKPAVTPADPVKPAPSAPEASACSGLPAGFEPFAALKWGDALYDPDFGMGEHDLALTKFFPEVEAEKGRVVMATPVEVDGSTAAPEMAAFLVPDGGTEATDYGTDYKFSLGLFRCGKAGFERIGADLEDMGGVGVYALATQLITLADGTAGTSLRVLHGFQAMEMVMYDHVLGHGGQIGTVEVGRQFVIEGGDMARSASVGGSGWFPTGTDLRFLALMERQDPESDGSTLYVSVRASLDGEGLHTDSAYADGWALFGAGAPPAWCDATPKTLRCARIDADGFRYGWFTGGWETAEAAKAAVEGAGGSVSAGDWAFLGEPGDEGPPPGPDGKAPAASLTFTTR
jgi:hypothetical protein